MEEAPHTGVEGDLIVGISAWTKSRKVWDGLSRRAFPAENRPSECPGLVRPPITLNVAMLRAITEDRNQHPPAWQVKRGLQPVSLQRSRNEYMPLPLLPNTGVRCVCGGGGGVRVAGRQVCGVCGGGGVAGVWWWQVRCAEILDMKEVRRTRRDTYRFRYDRIIEKGAG